MKATILGKEREPVNTYTQKDHEDAGRNGIALDMRLRGIAKEHHYVVGKHGYLAVEYQDGTLSAARKLF